MTALRLAKAGFAARRSKYGNKPVVIDNIRFASQREGNRFSALKLMERAGLITDLERQISYKLDVAGIHVSSYICDFRYRTHAGELVIEDSKGFETPEFKIKRKLMKACHGIDVVLS